MTVMLDKQPEPYQSVFLEDGWAHQRYFGWKVVLDQPGLRVLRKRRAIFSRYLMLLTKGGEASLTKAVRRALRWGQLSDIVIHDFDKLFPEEAKLSGCQFRGARKGERLLNTSTFVINLALPIEVLWYKLGDKSRNMVRKAEQQGVAFTPSEDFDEALIRFYGFYANLAAKYGLIPPKEKLLRRMLCDGTAKLLLSRDARGAIIAVSILYLIKNKAYSLYIASDQNAPAGLGQFLYWKTIEYLKNGGFRWYDLGGAGEKNQSDGIYVFKKSIGGTYVDLGEEYYYCGELARVQKPSLHWLQSLEPVSKIMFLDWRAWRGGV